MNRSKLHESRNEKEMNRREFLLKSTYVAAALPAAAAAMTLYGCTREDGSVKLEGAPKTPEAPAAPSGSGDDTRLVTEYPENKTILEALKYVSKSSHAAQTCENCQFFTANQQIKGTGKCQLIPRGLVRVEAWCASWQPAPSS